MKTILVADDNPASRELLRDALELRGFRVIEASDGREALNKLQEGPPDLVLLDIQMPLLDGFAVLKAARASDRLHEVPMIALTAFAMDSDRQCILAAGFDGYVSKPISIADLREQVERLLSEDIRANHAEP
jgi:CheY-like chemotaxis protein